MAAYREKVFHLFQDKQKRSWHVGSVEFRLAVGVSLLCIVLLGVFFFLPHHQKPKQATANIKASSPAQATHIAIKQPNKSVPHILKNKHTDSSPLTSISNKAHTQFSQIKTQKKAIKKTHMHGYMIQLGAFKSKQHATTLRHKFAQQNAIIQQKKNQLYAVLLGPYQDKAEAVQQKKELLKHANINGFIIYQP